MTHQFTPLKPVTLPHLELMVQFPELSGWPGQEEEGHRISNTEPLSEPINPPGHLSTTLAEKQHG